MIINAFGIIPFSRQIPKWWDSFGIKIAFWEKYVLQLKISRYFVTFINDSNITIIFNLGRILGIKSVLIAQITLFLFLSVHGPKISTTLERIVQIYLPYLLPFASLSSSSSLHLSLSSSSSSSRRLQSLSSCRGDQAIASLNLKVISTPISIVHHHKVISKSIAHAHSKCLCHDAYNWITFIIIINYIINIMNHQQYQHQTQSY